MEEVKIVKTENTKEYSNESCPKCGASNLSFDESKGVLRCNYCNQEFDLDKLENFENDISKLSGKSIGSGSTDISSNMNDICTLKCSGCGAEIMIDTSITLTAKCHWCGNDLNINAKMNNASIPDAILPFSITKEDAYNEMNSFLNKRRLFADKKFCSDFCIDNVMGVYLPYIVVDINSHVKFSGKGEITTDVHKKYDDSIVYFVDSYQVSRDFDLLIEGLTIESNAEKINSSIKNKDSTNYVINSILPFDIENAVKWNSNYLKGYNAERRDTNIADLENIVDVRTKDIARYSIKKTISKYDRGVSWENEQLNIVGSQWKTIYLPVWLYSYRHSVNNQETIHYIAVNGRTKETSGSVPVVNRALVIAIILAVLGVVLESFFPGSINLTFVSLIGYCAIYLVNRNFSARNKYEQETKSCMRNVVGSDKKIDSFKTKTCHVNNKNCDNLYGADKGAVALEKYKKSINNLGNTVSNIGKSIEDNIKK